MARTLWAAVWGLGWVLGAGAQFTELKTVAPTGDLHHVFEFPCTTAPDKWPDVRNPGSWFVLPVSGRLLSVALRLAPAAAPNASAAYSLRVLAATDVVVATSRPARAAAGPGPMFFAFPDDATLVETVAYWWELRREGGGAAGPGGGAVGRACPGPSGVPYAFTLTLRRASVHVALDQRCGPAPPRRWYAQSLRSAVDGVISDVEVQTWVPDQWARPECWSLSLRNASGGEAGDAVQGYLTNLVCGCGCGLGGVRSRGRGSGRESGMRESMNEHGKGGMEGGREREGGGEGGGEGVSE